VEIVARAAEDAQRAHDQGQVHGILDSAKLLARDGRGRALGPAQAGEWSIHCTPPEWPPNPPGPLEPSGDIYVLGAALYVLLTGQLPFAAPPDDLGARILRGDLVPPRQVVSSIPAALEAICLKALARDPKARYATAGEMAEALRSFLNPRRKVFWK